MRSFARNMLVGVNRISASLQKVGGELQVYEDLQGFALAAATCQRADDDAVQLILAYVEQANVTRAERRIRATDMRCAP